jgi:hypothetical protein
MPVARQRTYTIRRIYRPISKGAKKKKKGGKRE